MQVSCCSQSSTMWLCGHAIAAPGRGARVSEMIRFAGALAAFVLAAVATPVCAQVIPLPNGVEASSGGVSLRVEALTDSILRVRITPGRQWPEDASWAVSAAVRHERVAVQPTVDGF